MPPTTHHTTGGRPTGPESSAAERPLLIVDDDPVVRENLAVLLQMRGKVVETAENGLDALLRIDEIGPPCLIILDLIMPVMGGVEFRQELLRNPKLAGVPIIVVSGVVNAEPAARRLGAVGVMGKPLDLPMLYRLIEEYC